MEQGLETTNSETRPQATAYVRLGNIWSRWLAAPAIALLLAFLALHAWPIVFVLGPWFATWLWRKNRARRGVILPPSVWNGPPIYLTVVPLVLLIALNTLAGMSLALGLGAVYATSRIRGLDKYGIVSRVQVLNDRRVRLLSRCFGVFLEAVFAVLICGTMDEMLTPSRCECHTVDFFFDSFRDLSPYAGLFAIGLLRFLSLPGFTSQGFAAGAAVRVVVALRMFGLLAWWFWVLKAIDATLSFLEWAQGFIL